MCKAFRAICANRPPARWRVHARRLGGQDPGLRCRGAGRGHWKHTPLCRKISRIGWYRCVYFGQLVPLSGHCLRPAGPQHEILQWQKEASSAEPRAGKFTRVGVKRTGTYMHARLQTRAWHCIQYTNCSQMGREPQQPIEYRVARKCVRGPHAPCGIRLVTLQLATSSANRMNMWGRWKHTI